MRSRNRASPNTWSNGEDHQAKGGGPFCVITRRILRLWTCSFFVIVRLDRRELVWINVTTNPTAEWIARQITQAFPWDDAPKYLIRDRDQIYGAVVTRRLRAMGIRDKPTAPASPWQNGFAERLIGSIRRECVDHIIVLGEAHLRRILKSYAKYYNGVRTHRSLDKDAPVSRPVYRTGVICSRAILGGLHHRYVRV
ncbi:MAG TPA: integrase core domain-containing protein [Candidatus Acidoferrum sp.]|nr:integrase core domain-containing protein [Candidatus Acidoferrum sp.]